MIKSLNIAVIVSVLITGGAVMGKDGENSRYVYPGKKGKLEYQRDTQGNTIIDYSHCGYMGGGVAIPDVETVKVLTPSKAAMTDDTERIQMALDEVASRAVNAQGFRGAVLLRKGVYHINKTININASGVVLRGEGPFPGGTVIKVHKTPRVAVLVGESKKLTITEVPESRRQIINERVPVGSRTLTLNDVSPFKKGDQVVILRPASQQWINDIGMDPIPPRKDGIDRKLRWQAEDYEFRFRRVVTKVSGNTVTLDAPIVQALEAKYGGGFLYKYKLSKEVENSGIENLKLESDYTTGNNYIYVNMAIEQCIDEEHALNAVKITGDDCWASNLIAEHFGGSMVMLDGYRITVQDCASVNPVSLLTGGRRYSFSIGGQQCLVQRCYARFGRHDFVFGARTCGPNAFVDCISEDAFGPSEPHQRWAIGGLYDGVSVEGLSGWLYVCYRGDSGSGHGWSGANFVLWNCRAPVIGVQSPPGANNYAIGISGILKEGYERYTIKPAVDWMNMISNTDFKYENHPFVGNATFDVRSGLANPRSLYWRQLQDRLGVKAVEQVTLPEQRTGLMFDYLSKRYQEVSQTPKQEASKAQALQNSAETR